MLITKEIEIDMGHRVPNHKSKCRNLHGHRYKVEVGVDDKVISTKGSSDEGMVIDFGDLKEIMMEEIDAKHDHGFMMYEYDEFYGLFKQLYNMNDQKIIFTPFVPTAENIAKYWFQLIEPRLAERGIALRHVKIWETPTSTAIFEKSVCPQCVCLEKMPQVVMCAPVEIGGPSARGTTSKVRPKADLSNPCRLTH